MDKILRRVAMAERQVARRVKRWQEQSLGREKNRRLKEVARVRREASMSMNTAIKVRHEDLKLGPLAPRRDVSKVDEHGNHWGSISTERALLQTKITPAQKEARSAWAGGPKYLCLAPGDRVVITEGPEKGKISTITNIKKEYMTLELEGQVSMVNATMPSFLLDKDQSPVQTTKSVIPVSAVRLVHPLKNPETGVVRDVIIRELKPVGIIHDRPTGKRFFTRMVPGLNVRIPWPDVKPATYEDHPIDTLRIDVEERTFVPTLLRPPMPEAVLNELRNAYSKFRTRHTPEYIAKIEAQEAQKKANRKGGRTDEMLLPVQEYNRKMRQVRRERGKPELSEDMLEKIGEVIAKNKLVRKQGAAQAKEKEKESVETVRKAVEELSVGGEPTTDGQQPTA